MEVKLWICNEILEGSIFTPITEDDDDNDKDNDVSKSQV